MPRPSKRSLPATKRQSLKAMQNVEAALDNIYETSYVNLDDADADDESVDSSSSGDDEDFTRFYSKFTVALAKWAEAEAKLRATHTGSSQWTEYRKRQREEDRAKEYGNCFLHTHF